MVTHTKMQRTGSLRLCHYWHGVKLEANAGAIVDVDAKCERTVQSNYCNVSFHHKRILCDTVPLTSNWFRS